MAVKLEWDGDIAILSPKGSLLGGDETVALETAIRDLAEKGNTKLVIDLGKVDMMVSRPLGVLVAAHANYVRRDGKIYLCNVENKIKNLMVITRLVSVFDIYGTREGALGSF
ncbi:MAG: STAS domain-containing protein [Candidatus Eisenbacteria bacterium]|nr:STAS domain-containing protein [Candidatus Eisenbacteria bacterium]